MECTDKFKKELADLIDIPHWTVSDIFAILNLLKQNKTQVEDRIAQVNPQLVLTLPSVGTFRDTCNYRHIVSIATHFAWFKPDIGWKCPYPISGCPVKLSTLPFVDALWSSCSLDIWKHAVVYYDITTQVYDTCNDEAVETYAYLSERSTAFTVDVAALKNKRAYDITPVYDNLFLKCMLRVVNDVLTGHPPSSALISTEAAKYFEWDRYGKRR